MARINSEVGRLRRVVVHRPGAALARMLPEHIDPRSPHYLLFDDLVHVPDAQKEHEQLCRVLETTAEVGFFDEMLVNTLEAKEARDFVISEVCRLEELPDKAANRLGEMGASELANTLVAGAEKGLLHQGRPLSPLPNLLFTRDLAAMVGDLLIVGNARKRARKRESILTWALVKHHPWFADARISQNCRWVLDSGGSFPLTVEGGDILTLSDSLALIGASERTSWAMIVALGQELIAEGFGRVLVVEMPKQRSSMHLDTVFTMVDWDKAVLYGPILEAGGREEVQVIRMHGEGKKVQIEVVKGNLVDALAAEEHPVSAIRCGAGDPIHEQREQWTDGSNYVAISPGVVLGYARNRHTSEAMKEAGFRVVSADTFLAELDQDFGGDFSALVGSERRYAVQIIGSELSRGRGGPRCLTLPLLRD